MRKDYHTPANQSSWLARHLPGIYFYSMTVLDVLAASRRCKKNTYSLNKKSQLPIVPIALKTDAWGIGRVLKDIGKIDPAKPVRMAFGDPIYITGNGKQEHQKIIRFIEEKLKGWAE
jgi:hypothetical protein